MIGHVKALRLCPDTITDSHPNLRPLCETLEVIFRKGIQREFVCSNSSDVRFTIYVVRSYAFYNDFVFVIANLCQATCKW